MIAPASLYRTPYVAPKPPPAPKAPAEASPEIAKVDQFEKTGAGKPLSSPAPAPGVFAPPPPPPPGSPAPFGAPSTSDASATEVYTMTSKNAFLDPTQAKRVVELAKKDAKLAPGETDPKKIAGAVEGLYVRSGFSGPAAHKMAAETVKTAQTGGFVKVDNSPGKSPTKDEAKVMFESAEADVAKNTDADKVWSSADIKKNPTEFVRNVTQLDGDTKTTSDNTGCVPASMLGGALLKDPESVQKLGKSLNSEKGKSEFPGLQKAPYKAAVDRIASGSYSPRDVSLLSKGMHDEMQHDGSTGLTLGREMEMLGKLKKIGWTPPPMERTSYGGDNGGGSRTNVHSNVKSNGVGYDPWSYPGSDGKSVVLDASAADQHAKTIPGAFGSPKKNAALESVTHDGNGNVVISRAIVDGKERNPPLAAKYTFDEKSSAWVRDPAVKVDAKDEEWLPKSIPLDPKARKGTKIEDV